MHSVKMRPVATHVAWSVCLFVTTVSPTKTDERTQMPLQCKLTGAGQRNASLLLSGDVELNPGPSKFTICTFNIRSILYPLHSFSFIYYL